MRIVSFYICNLNKEGEAVSKEINYEQAEKDYMNGMKYKDIASKYGVSLNTVKSWKTRYKWNKKGMHTKSEKVCIQKKNSGSKKCRKKEPVAEEVLDIIQNTELTDKQRIFCICYIRCFNATKAYQKAYECDYVTAMVNGSCLLRNTKVKEEIQRLKQNRLNREFFSEEDLFQKYMDIACADMSDFTEFGNKDIKVINPDTGKEEEITISYVNIKNSSEVDGTLISEVSKGKDGVKVKLADRMKAMQWLSDHMDLATEEHKARIAMLRAKVETNEEENTDDGFIDALNASAEEDWSDEKD